MLHRPRRNRKSAAIRQMVQQTHLCVHDLIYPLFVCERKEGKEALPSLPDTFRHSLSSLIEEVERAYTLGIRAVMLFPVIPKEKRDPYGKEALNPKGLLSTAITLIKKLFPSLCVMADVALDPYTTHGHDGVMNASGEIDNDATVDLLCAMALVQANAGVDMVAPSDMMDGRVQAIRMHLDEKGHTNVNIHAYCAKYASCFYGPFREALGTNPQGDKLTYQMDPANQKEALREAFLDEQEGADFLMVKPAVHYLDVISKIKERTLLPVSAYHVSGEYALLHAAAQQGWLCFERALIETTVCIKRAGADLIITYGALKLAKSLSETHQRLSFSTKSNKESPVAVL